MAAGSAAERAETGGIQKARFRGREVVLTFSMQASGSPLLVLIIQMTRHAAAELPFCDLMPICRISLSQCTSLCSGMAVPIVLSLKL